jgi:hypothetical protein
VSVRSGLKNLGTTGHTSELHFLDALGRPSAVKTLQTGDRLLEWRSGRLRAQMVAVLFNRDGEFVRVAARYPSGRASHRDNVAVIELRDEIVRPDRGHSLWSRSPQ